MCAPFQEERRTNNTIIVFLPASTRFVRGENGVEAFLSLFLVSGQVLLQFHDADALGNYHGHAVEIDFFL